MLRFGLGVHSRFLLNGLALYIRDIGEEGDTQRWGGGEICMVAHPFFHVQKGIQNALSVGCLDRRLMEVIK